MREKKPILLVEDNRDDVNLILYALEQAHILNKIVVKYDGDEAFKYLFDSKNENASGQINGPVLVILDLKLPGMDGYELLEKIRANPQTQLIPVVVLTASTEEDTIALSYRLGANSLIRKPVEINRFIEAVKHVGLYWLALNETADQ